MAFIRQPALPRAGCVVRDQFTTTAASRAARWTGPACTVCLEDIGERTGLMFVVVYKDRRLSRSARHFAKLGWRCSDRTVPSFSVTSRSTRPRRWERADAEHLALVRAVSRREVRPSALSATRSPAAGKKGCGWGVPPIRLTASRMEVGSWTRPRPELCPAGLRSASSKIGSGTELRDARCEAWRPDAGRWQQDRQKYLSRS